MCMCVSVCVRVVHTINPSALPTSDIPGRYMFDCKLLFIVSPTVTISAQQQNSDVIFEGNSLSGHFSPTPRLQG